MDHEEFSIHIHAIKEYTVMIDALEQEVKRLRECCLRYMKQHQLSETIVDDISVNISQIRTHRFDITLFKEQQPELYASFLKPVVAERLAVKHDSLKKLNVNNAS